MDPVLPIAGVSREGRCDMVPAHKGHGYATKLRLAVVHRVLPVHHTTHRTARCLQTNRRSIWVREDSAWQSCRPTRSGSSERLPDLRRVSACREVSVGSVFRATAPQHLLQAKVLEQRLVVGSQLAAQRVQLLPDRFVLPLQFVILLAE